MNKRTIIDITMTILSVILMGGTLLFPTDIVHQILGFALFVLWTFHTILNRRWYTLLFKGSYSPFRVMQIVVNLSLLLCAVLLMVSGLMMAFGSIGMEFARTAHLLASHWYYLFMSVHIGLHANVILARIKSRHSPQAQSDDSQKSARSAKSAVLRVILLLICAYGVYAFIVRGIGKYLILRQQFFFLDLERGYILFVVDYLAILVLFATLVHLLASLLLRKK